MSDKRKDLPPANTPQFLQQVREAVSTYLGTRGDRLDRGVTVRDLVDAGLVELNESYLAGRGKTPIKGPGSGLGGGNTTVVVPGEPGGGDPYEPDLTPPPSPSGVTVNAGIDFLMFVTDPPLYLQGHGHARTRVFGATWVSGAKPTFSDAVEITQFLGNVDSYPTNPATEWHIWLKWVTNDGVESAVPSGGTNGHVAVTGQDPALLLKILTGQIKQDQLYADLGARINLIDAPDTTPGSVAARIKSEATARANADNAISSIVDQVSATVDGNTAAIQTEATTRANQTGQLFAQYTVKLDVGGKVSGYGLASSSTSSTFAIRADRFYIAAPAGVGGVNDVVPFAVQATPTLTPAGELLPAGVYIDAAYVRNLEAALGRFQNAFITNAMVVSLSASRLTSGVISVGNYIQSSNYVPGVQGWRIFGDGNAEFAAAVIRGQLSAAQMNGNGLSIYHRVTGKLIIDAGANVPIPADMIAAPISTLNADPMLLDGASAWDLDAGLVIQGPSTAAGATGSKYISADTSGQKWAWSKTRIPWSSKRRMDFSALLYAGAGNDRNMYLVVRMWRGDGREYGGIDLGWPAGLASWGGTYAGYAFGGLPATGRFSQYGAAFGFGTARPVPEDVAYIRVGVWFQYQDGTSNVQQAAEEIRVIDSTDQAAAEAAKVAADGAQSSANSALGTLAAMRSNGILDASEKPSLIKLWNEIYNERPTLEAQANVYGLTTEWANYWAQYLQLSNYLGSLSPRWDDTSADTPIVPATDQSNWSTFYYQRNQLRQAIAIAAGKVANWNGVSGAGKPLDNAGKVVDGDRDTNRLPPWYPVGVTREFKHAAAIGLNDADGYYLTLETNKQWVDDSGGPTVQYAYQTLKTWRRYGTNSAEVWGAWVQDLDRNSYTGDLNASAGVTLINQAGMTISGSTVTKNLASYGWNSGVCSKDSYTGGAFVSWKISTIGNHGLGLNTDPLTDAHFGTIDWWLYCAGDQQGQLYIYSNGSQVTANPIGTAGLGDVLALTFDGSNVRAMKNGTVLWERAWTSTAPLFLDSSFDTVGCSVSNIQFGPMTSNNWSAVGGAGKPQDNATVGATVGLNLGGSFDQSSFDVIMAGRSLIRAAHIQSLSVDVLSTTLNGGSAVGLRAVANQLSCLDEFGTRRTVFGKRTV